MKTFVVTCLIPNVPGGVKTFVGSIDEENEGFFAIKTEDGNAHFFSKSLFSYEAADGE